LADVRDIPLAVDKKPRYPTLAAENGLTGLPTAGMVPVTTVQLRSQKVPE
jgi:hypothetical protein